MTNPCNIIKLNPTTHTLETPVLILKNRNLEPISEIKYFTNWRMIFQAMGLDEISFDIYKELNGIPCELWDKIIDLAVIEVRGYGHFEISVSVSDGADTVKTVTGQSLETELGQLTLHEFHVNDEDAMTMEQTQYNTDDFDEKGNWIPTVFYDKNDPKHSLLHRVLADKAPHWSIGNVPLYISINETDKPEPASTFQRTYTADGTTIYDFLMNEVAKESNVVFVFDTYNRIIHCYNAQDFIWIPANSEEPSILIDAVGEDTTVFIDKENLANQITISGSKDNIKNCFRVSGGDDIITDRLRAVNMNGTNYIYAFSPAQLNDMPFELAEKLKNYQADMEQKEAEYYGSDGIYTKLCDAYDEYYHYESKMMPQVTLQETTAKAQHDELADKLGNMDIGVYSLNSYNAALFSGITNNIEAMAQVFIDSRYKAEVINDTSSKPTYDGTAQWKGRFKIYRIADETDIYTTPDNSPLAVSLTEDNVELHRQKVLKALCKTSMADIDFEIANMNDGEIKAYFSKYCRVRLQSFLDGYETCISILAEMKHETTSSDNSNGTTDTTLYGKYLKIRNIVSEVLKTRTAQVNECRKKIKNLEDEQANFQKEYNLETYLNNGSTQNLFQILCMYRRDSEYQNSNYISAGLEDNDAALNQKAKELLDIAKAEIKKACMLQRTITIDLNNPLFIEDFSPVYDKFALFNYIRVGTDDEIFKLRLMGVEYDSNSPQALNVTFSEQIESVNGCLSDAESMYNRITSIASSYSATALQAKSGKEANDEVAAMRNNGLNAALTRVTNSDDNEVTYGSFGILCKNKLNEGVYSNTQTRLVGSGLYITSDNWETVRACIGQLSDNTYGVIADSIVGKMIAGEKLVISNADGNVTMNGNGIEISNGSLSLTNGNSAITLDPRQAHLVEISKVENNNKEPLFYTDEKGNLYITGTIYATDGTFSGNITSKASINGSTISGSSIQGGKININGKFIVDEQGNVNITSGQINIANNFLIDSYGNLTSKGTMSLGNGKLTYDDSSLIINGIVNAVGGTFSNTITCEGTISGGTISGAVITGSRINVGDGAFFVDTAGNLTATKASIEGKINATSGQIGGFRITANKICGGDGSDEFPTVVMQRPTETNLNIFAVGGTSHDSYSDCSFRVTKNGNLYCKKSYMISPYISSGIYMTGLGDFDEADNYTKIIGTMYDENVFSPSLNGVWYINNTIRLPKGKYIDSSLDAIDGVESGRNTGYHHILGISNENNLHLGSGLFDPFSESKTYVNAGTKLIFRTATEHIYFQPQQKLFEEDPGTVMEITKDNVTIRKPLVLESNTINGIPIIDIPTLKSKIEILESRIIHLESLIS